MVILRTIEETQNYIRRNKASGKRIGFVPTMGFLHQGHLKLMKVARDENDIIVASIFVNPMQFGVNEDYDNYPRDLTRDAELAQSVGVDMIFAPTVADMYPKGYSTFVEVAGLTEKLCGLSRPGHFKGVTTVVNKLFNIVQPDIAYFGQKDAQQVLVIQKMVQDLNMNLNVKVIQTVRETDGLAMSSRNAYLNPEERQAALVLYKTLSKAKEALGAGERSRAKLKGYLETLISAEPLARIDYVDILGMPDLNEMEQLDGKILIAMAVYIGGTRLIDNMMVEV